MPDTQRARLSSIILSVTLASPAADDLLMMTSSESRPTLFVSSAAAANYRQPRLSNLLPPGEHNQISEFTTGRDDPESVKIQSLPSRTVQKLQQISFIIF